MASRRLESNEMGGARMSRNQMTVEAVTTPSTDGKHTLRGVVYYPHIEIPLGILQIAHGMAEHIGRYDDFMRAVCEAGFIVCGHDHLGHGQTVEDKSEFGYFAEKNGWRIVVDDVLAFGNAVSQRYPGLPHFLLGHSMGSFLARAAVATYPGDYDALIIMGTGGTNPLSTMGLGITSIIGKIKGQKYISKLTEALAFGSYNKHTDSEDIFAWLTCDEELLQKHNNDPLCLIKFTVSAMNDLIAVQKAVNQPSWYQNIPKTLPILLVSGEEDPVGAYGKGVTEVHDKLLKEGCTKVACILYPNMRHEILNEIGRETVYTDIISFLNQQIK
jgi:alpha-beta hydrolase superfamily lysophospholipase